MVYECEGCGIRLLGEQRCEECGSFMRRVGRGGLCPCCDQPITLEEILAT
jgi:predicted amidophosphoribosyltransferase